MRMGRYSHSQGQKENQSTPDNPEPLDSLILFLQDLFRFNRTDKIVAIIIAIMVIVGHVWFGCK